MTIQPARTLSTKTVSFLVAFAVLFTWMNLATKFLIASGIMPAPSSPISTFEMLPLPQFLIFFFFSNLWAPFWEEFCFRYSPLTLASLAGEKAILPVIIISSCLFGYLHGHGPYSVFLQGVMGLVFSWLYLRNGIWWSVLLHATWNTYQDFI